MTDPAMGKLGKYELLERLAVGGMAELFKAQIVGDHGFKKLVAIKKILPHLAASTAFVDMFVDEARITAVLEHPNIVQVFEFGQEGNELFLVMQLVDGVDLLDLLRKGKKLDMRLSTELSVHVTHEILDALDYAHNARDVDGRPLGIVHRDISPGNVLVSRRGSVMLTDFGIAWAYERHQKTEAGKLKGKFGYMSPEQVAGAPLDPRSDVFSTGVLLAEMLIGRHLFVGPSDLEILLMVRDADLERLERHGEHIPADLMAILRKAMAKRPDRRFASAAAFREALADWLFRRGVRVSAADVAAYIGTIQQAIDERAPGNRDSGIMGKTPPPMALSGPETLQHRMDAVAAADAARAAYREATSRAADQRTGARPPSYEALEMDEVKVMSSTRAETVALGEHGLDKPTERGDFTDISPMRVLYLLVETEATGLLVVEGRAGIFKEAYFRDGHPEFVMSNVLGERLGDYLIAKGVIRPEERDRAVELMPHFGNHLIDTFIGLGLMDPLHAFRHLGRQVAHKLIDVCTWTKGKYRWYRGRPNPWPARKLALDTYEILGAGARALEVEQVVAWAKLVRDRRIARIRTDVPLQRFGLGESMDQARALMDAVSTVTELAGRVREPEARLEFLRVLYLLVNSQLAILA